MNLDERIFHLGVRHRGTALLLLVLVSVVLAPGIPRLRIDTGFSSLIPERDPQRLVYEQVAEQFGSDNRTLIYVSDPGLWGTGEAGPAGEPALRARGARFRRTGR